MHLMVLLGDVGEVEAHFSLFGDSVNLDARQVHGLRQMHYWLRNHFGCTRWYSDVTFCEVDPCFSPFGDSASLDVR